MPAVWPESMTTGVPTLDDLYQRLLRQINDLFALVQRGEADGALDAVEEWVRRAEAEQGNHFVASDPPSLQRTLDLENLRSRLRDTAVSPGALVDVQRQLGRTVLAHARAVARLQDASLRAAMPVACTEDSGLAVADATLGIA